QMRRCLDLSAIDTGAYLQFVYGETNADEGAGAEGIEVSFNTVCDAACVCTGTWQTAFVHYSDLGTDPSRRTWFVDLSSLSAAVNNNVHS
ncbi:MAG: hypothetical protein HYR93_11050, partial [Chloroflexi bacterium]|nr:hypothetical protein [Chloroflexota bacterium]